MLNIAPPPAMQGDGGAQLAQVYRYLFRLSEQLNMALSGTEERLAVIQPSANGAVSEDKLSADLAKQYNSIKSLIIKTADVVRSEMDVIVTSLDSKYVALSEWGKYREEVHREIEDTAKYTIENYQYGEGVLNLPELAAEFEAYRLETEGFIKRGIIGYDDEGFPILGIAIGQTLKSRTVTIDDVEYEEFDTTENMATYTSEKLSFWIDGVEVAYLSNSELVVTRIIVADSIQLGGWNIDVNAEDGMTVQRRIGDALDLSGNNTIRITADQINAVADQIDLSGNTSIQLTADQVNAVANQINLSGNESIVLIAGEANAAREQANAAQEQAEAAQAAVENTVALVQTLYALGDSQTEPPAEGWSATAPAHEAGRYVWQKIVTTYNSGETKISEPACISGADGEPATTLRIDSSRGTVFKNSAVSTVLTAVIYRGSERITELAELRRVFGAGAYLQWSWQRMDEERFGVILSDDARLSQGGFAFALSPEDVDTKVTFMCELIV